MYRIEQENMFALDPTLVLFERDNTLGLEM
jgi:hypothetical protein